jgi:nucleotide-binding universal stress UspA family protein
MTVFVGVDSSEASTAALRLAVQEARWRQASLMKILHGEGLKVPTWEQPTASAGAPASAT